MEINNNSNSQITSIEGIYENVKEISDIKNAYKNIKRLYVENKHYKDMNYLINRKSILDKFLNKNIAHNKVYNSTTPVATSLLG